MSHRVAVIAGDGAGPEVVAEARKAVDALGLDLDWSELLWGSAHYHETGTMMPPDALDVVRGHDAVLLGSVGDPSVPDHVTLWGLLLPLRQGLDLWANIRPARLLEGIPSPLAGSPRVDLVVVRENTEGEYSGIGGRAHTGHPHEVGVETAVFTREGVRRVVEHAFELAEQRGGRLTSATKSNASRYGYVLWDEVVEEAAAAHPSVTVDRALVDALAARMVTDPASVDVILASNLFGDILTDLGAAVSGSLGIAPSGNINPERKHPSMFEPIHGSAPDIKGKGIANPIGAIWAGAMMLDHLGAKDGHDLVVGAIERVLAAPGAPRTPDLGGRATTSDVAAAILQELK